MFSENLFVNLSNGYAMNCMIKQLGALLYSPDPLLSGECALTPIATAAAEWGVWLLSGLGGVGTGPSCVDADEALTGVKLLVCSVFGLTEAAAAARMLICGECMAGLCCMPAVCGGERW